MYAKKRNSRDFLSSASASRSASSGAEGKIKKYKPVLLIILDGWGISPSWGGNALAVNSPKNMNRYWRDYPHKVLQAFTLVAGKYGVVGDSRLGHSTIAAGRRIPQDLEIISESISDKSFYRNKILIQAIEHAKKYRSNLHLIGLVSNGGIHSHVSHLNALIELCHRNNFSDVYIDAITDGIDSGSFDSLSVIEGVKSKILETGIGQFSTCIGRNFAMDRIGNFSKTRACYELISEGAGTRYHSINSAISESYRQGYNDFNLPPAVIENNGKITTLKNDDSIIFFNYRSDRSLQLTKMFLGTGLKKLFHKTLHLRNLHITTFTEYERNLPVKIAFAKNNVIGTLGEILSKYQEKQLRIAESEKEAHVTSFFNCGNGAVYEGEDRKIIASKTVDPPSKDPIMQAPKITKVVIDAVKNKKYDFILVNLANVDMMSHTGDMIAAGKAIHAVDEVVGKMVDANIKAGGATIVTADHGNVEEMVKLNPNQDPETKHTLNPVPFILITADNKKNLIKSAVSSPYFSLSKIITAKETLADIAPTILEIMGLPKSEEMTGHSLLNSLE